jgi:hypothetical protein
MQAFELNSSLNESIYFDFVPTPTYAGHLNRYPFKITITSSNDNPHVVFLDSKYSKSYTPQENKSKWSFLRPEVRFLDLSGNQIKSIVTNDTKIYKDNSGVLNTITGNFIGVSGYAEFYFVDDLYNYDLAFQNKKYSTIVAVLETSGVNFFSEDISDHILSSQYSNTRAIAYQPHIFTYRDPDYIKISENGIRDYINPRWIPVDQHVVFTFNWDSNKNEIKFEGNDSIPASLESSFNKNLPSNSNTDTIQFQAGSDQIKLFFNDPLQIKYLDNNKYLTPGYCKTFFNVGTAAFSVTLSAVATYNSPDTNGMNYSPKLWLSNPNAGLMGIVEYNFPTLFNLNSANLNKANIYNFEVPIFQPSYKRISQNENGDQIDDAFPISYYHGINSIAVLPPPSYQAWGVDGELNYLYKFNSLGKILSAINLVDLVNNSVDSNGYTILPKPLIDYQVSPTSVVLDGNQNLWITLYDNRYVLNVDGKDGTLIYALDIEQSFPYVVPPKINTDWYEANQGYPNLNATDENFIEPTICDVDSKNNIWVTYSNYASGYLMKFDRNNNALQSFQYPVCSCPQDIIIDNQDNVWVALSNNLWNSLGSIEKRNTNGVILSAFGPIRGMNEMALDLNQNLWFTYSYSRLGCIDNITNEITTFNVLDNSDAAHYASSEQTNPNINTDETALEGIACDLKGYLYVVNSVENQVYIYNTKTKKYVDKFYVNPKGFVFWNPEEGGDTLIEYNQWNKSLQAHGDWIGSRWINKYDKKDKTYQATVSGRSPTYLDFVNLISTATDDPNSYLASTFFKYIDTTYLQQIAVTHSKSQAAVSRSWNIDVFKVNENYDLAAQMKSYAFTPTLFESKYLFETFLPSIYGTYPFSHYDMGLLSYEKISNFVSNHSDVDICELDSLYNLADSVNSNTDDYMLNYPNEIKRLMNILSVNPCRILGSTQKNQDNFKNPADDGSFNRGQLLTLNYKVTAGVPVVLKTKSLDSYEIVQTGPLGVNYTSPQASKIVNSLTNFKKIIMDKKVAPKTYPTGYSLGFIPISSYKVASNLLLNYKESLQSQIIEYTRGVLDQNIISDYNLALKCYRDIGYIVDAIAADLANVANHRSVDVGDIYFKGPILGNVNSYSDVPTLPRDQVQVTINAISALNIYINGINIPEYPTPFTTVGILSSKDLIPLKDFVSARINDVIYPLQNNGLLMDYFPQGDPTDKDIELADRILSKKYQIQDGIASYVSSMKYLNFNPIDKKLTEEYSAKCKRDVGLMIDSVVNDIKTGVVSKSIQYALAYWNGSTSRLPQGTIKNQRAKTLDVIDALTRALLEVYNEEPDNEKINVYSLQELVNFLGLNYNLDNWQGYYEFYEFVPSTNTNYSNNIVDWNNPQTTLSNNISSISEWVSDEHYIDTLFSYKLYTGLGII